MPTFIARDLSSLKSFRNKMNNKKLSMVPTMGALHKGHLSLIKKAKSLADRVIVTIFINPIQFNNRKDLNSYPISEKEDIEKLKQLKVDIIFIPRIKEIYPKNYSTFIKLKMYNDILCAKKRKNHFVGVATILTKLFFLIKPQYAIFGEKDYQQLIIIKKLVKDFFISTKIITVKTVRDKNGLALSSRNHLLKPEEYEKAIQINKKLKKFKKYSLSSYDSYLSKTIKELKKIGLNRIDYLEIRDEIELKNYVDCVEAETLKFRIFIALYVGKIRLIDNMKIN